MLKFCNCCKREKPLEEFTKMGRKEFTKGNFKRNYKTSDGYHSYCKECNALKAKEFRQRHKALTGNADYRGSGKITSIPKEDRLLMSAIRNRVTYSKSNNKRHPEREFNIDDMYMYGLWKKQQGKCVLTGFPMSIQGDTNLRLSIDKIIPELGYTKGNVQWTIFAANRAKGDMCMDDLISLCKMIIERATTIENIEKSGSE